MTDIPTDVIARRLAEAVAAIEDAISRSRQAIGGATTGPSDEARPALEQEWAAFKSDLSDLLNRRDVADSPEYMSALARIRSSMLGIAETISTVGNKAPQRAREGLGRLSAFAEASPLQAAGVAAIAGFVLGILLSRK